MNRNNMFTNYEPLVCKHCGKDTLQNPTGSIVVIDEQNNFVSDVFVCCKGNCDRALGSVSGWKELSDFTNPYLYMKHLMAVFNNIHENQMKFTDEAFSGYKTVLLRTAPFVFRDLSEEELDKAHMSNMLPF